MRTLIALLGAIIAGCAGQAGSGYFSQAKSNLTPVIVGYYAGWKDTPIDARKLTVVNYAFIEMDWSVGGRDRENLARLAAMKKQNATLRLVASVGGWTRSDRFSDVFADPALRAQFIRGGVAFLRTHDFDGIDIDWEYPGAIGVPCAANVTCDRPEDKRNFATFGRELRAALDAAGAADNRRYLFTIAAANDRNYLYDRGSAQWLRDLAGSLDWINLMTYDYHGTWENAAGFLAPLGRDPADPANANVEDTVDAYLGEGIPARKLTLGLPLYAKGWTGCEPGPRGDGLYQPCTSPLPDPPEASYEFAQLADLGFLARDSQSQHTVAGRGFTRHWSEKARVPYLYNAATKVFITYEDERSIGEKVRYARSKRLLGAMYWEIAADRDHVLADVVATELR